MTSTVTPELDRIIGDKADSWARELIQLDQRNTLLSFDPAKAAGAVDLSAAPPRTLADLRAGAKVRLSALITDPEPFKRAVSRMRVLRRKVQELDEEQGIEAGKIGFGLLRTPAPTVRAVGGQLVLRAPLVLRGVTITGGGPGESDFFLEAVEDLEPNPVLLHALEREFHADFDVDEMEDMLSAVIAECGAGDDPAERVFAAITTRVPDLAVTYEACAAVGLFSYDKLPMVNDLKSATDLLASSTIVAALAGHQPAMQDLAMADLGGIPATDDIHPRDEFLVQDADSSQQRAVSAALAGHNAVIVGPPGTGKSQTIANIIAGAAALGKRVLFVAEKRAAIEAVTQRLADVDLGGLVFDLHQKKISRKQVAQQLSASLERAAGELPQPVESLHERLITLRNETNAHSRVLHEPIAPWGLSPFQVQDRLVSMPPAAASRLRVRTPGLNQLDQQTVDRVEDTLRGFVNRGGLRIRRRESPWADADVHQEEDVRRVLFQLDELTAGTLRQSTSDMDRLVGQLGFPRPADLNQWQSLLDLLDGVSRSVAEFNAEVYGVDLDRMLVATGTRAFRKGVGLPVGFWERRKLRKHGTALSRSGLTGPGLHAALLRVHEERATWHHLSQGRSRPMQVMDLAQIMGRFGQVRNQLAAVALCVRLGDITTQPTAQVESKLAELDADRGTLHHILRINQDTKYLEALGLGPLLDEVARQDLDADRAIDLFRHAWLASLLDEFTLQVPAFREFVGRQHNDVVGQYVDRDLEHLATNRRRVRRLVAEKLHHARDNHRDQGQLVQREANKKSRHIPLRKLVEQAPDVLLAVHPCWAMSPLVVSRMLPAARLFDLVIFDEASQIEPHDAVTSIMRGAQLVIAGDPKQLPPTRVFQRILHTDTADDEDEADDIGNYESILAVLSAVLPEHTLTWHYRSRDERLIAFSNRKIYDNKLVTFPGCHAESPLTSVVVDGYAAPGQSGIASAEVAKVAELVMEHARTRPDETLGVIAFGAKHSEAIERALRQARAEEPELEAFFSDEKAPGKRFFVKNLERVQGDERDAIILSVGKPKAATGRVNMNFGNLGHEGGERRLNVAITRAKARMTVVSSFSHYEMEPNATKNIGPELLRQFLEFAATDQRLDRIGHSRPTPLNGLETSVLHALREEGIDVHPQWGVSGYWIDFALAHPDEPGRMVLAVETDGKRYHAGHSARDRDRLRQGHLENLGWRFLRVWSTDWFRDPGGETARVVAAWRRAVDDANRPPAPVAAPVARREVTEVQRGPRPAIPRRASIAEYLDTELVALFDWLLGDQRLIDRETRLTQAKDELGFTRMGPRIRERLEAAYAMTQHAQGRTAH
ncbi:AAA domain-containing protein [Actinokineospora sp. PR83]|uniref:AAA domain-containing protein n=1 Tax=Actinokineospora sp. PR83 TaxID=2884908 RepID=UPI0027DEB80E|nr:AAA domain-containing protein [Actinokineospora sp. PR83]MCG8917650.1 AAA domain-containing protein [Actinokineospora sp. PR83]